MCGIAAFFSSDKRISTERLKRATNSLHHRDPDSQGVWLSPNQRVGLGHARLSIINLATGDQPIGNENERGPNAEISVKALIGRLLCCFGGPSWESNTLSRTCKMDRFINIASVAGLAGGYTPHSYSAAKFGLVGPDLDYCLGNQAKPNIYLLHHHRGAT